VGAGWWVPRRSAGLPVQFFSELPPAELRDIDSTTLGAIREMGGTEGVISADSLGLRGPYVELSPATHDSLFARGVIRGWERLHRRFGEHVSIFSVSRVAFNRDHTQAVVQLADLCASLCGHGEYLLMEKHDGTWDVKRVIMPMSF
jgi:hypothetical protein